MTEKSTPQKEKSKPNQPNKLDEALDESFPSSDPLPTNPGSDKSPPGKKSS